MTGSQESKRGARHVLVCGWREVDERAPVPADDAGWELARAESAEELLEAATRDVPAVVLLGPDCENVTLLVSQLVALTPEPAVVVMFDQPAEADLLAAIHAGAVGYLPVTIPPARLGAVIDAVLEGQPALPRSMTQTLVRQFRSPGGIILGGDAGEAIELSPREWEVLCLLRQGCTTTAIAEQLYVSAATVRSHVASVMHKLGAPDREGALGAIFPG